MNKRMLSLGFAVALFFSTAIVLAQEQATAPTFKEGDTWQFKCYSQGRRLSVRWYELSVTQGAVKLYEVNSGQKNEIPIQPDGPTQVLLGLVGKSNHRSDLKFPLSAGQKWIYQYETRPAGLARDQRRYVEVNVAGMTLVTTPAGSFKAYKLIKSESWSPTGNGGGTGGGSSTTTYFYSPETRSIVKASLANDNPGTVETELIKFTPGN